MSGSHTSALLEISGLSVRFGGHDAVRGISLSIGSRETHAVVGESGSGKSATALSVLRLNPPQADIAGTIAFEGQDLLALSDRELQRVRGRGIAMIFQEPMVSLNPVLRVGVQVGEAVRRHRGLKGRALRDETIRLLAKVRLPTPGALVDRYPHHLSGGQRQRVMIAMAIASRPQLLIADEPTTALDVTIQAEILDLLDGLKQELGMSILLITHDLGLVARHADRVSVMHAGEIVEHGATDDILNRPAHAYTRGLLGASLHLDDVRHYRQQRLSEIRKGQDPATGATTFELVVPRSGTAPGITPLQNPAAPLLDVRDLHVAYAGAGGSAVRAVDGVSFSLAAGETLGLVGESGCGKSTLSKAILRLVPATSGQVLIDGIDQLTLDERVLRRQRGKIQMVFQDPYSSLNPRRTVGDMLDTTQQLAGEQDRASRLRRARDLIDQVGLPAASLQRYPREFSGGQRQRLGIARALAQRPRLIICDEPVSALDVSVQAQILNLLAELKQEHGLSYLFISHDLGVVRYFTDRVVVMKDGRLVEEGSHQDIWHYPQHDYTRRLIAAVPRPALPAEASRPAFIQGIR